MSRWAAANKMPMNLLVGALSKKAARRSADDMNMTPEEEALLLHVLE
jgi:hypothetical protein